MEKKIAFIGTGAMGGAILQAASRGLDPSQIIITDRIQEKAEALAHTLGCKAVPTNQMAAEEADYILLCIKPQTCRPVLEEIGPILRESMSAGRPKCLISILAGVTIETIRAIVGSPFHPVIRVMPNTPAQIGKGLMLLAADAVIGEGERKDVEHVIASCGVSRWIEEAIMDKATIMSGCSPAFVYMFIEALTDGGVALGLTRDDARTFAAQGVFGAAAMVLETGEHPMALKDVVTSPGGSTIAGVLALEEEGLRRAVLRAVSASYVRNIQLGQLD